MIAHIFGKAVEKMNSSIIVDVHGVGYEIQVPTVDMDATELGGDVRFYTYHYVREQSEELFGFSSLIGKKLFELLITVQGVGPKAALAILSLGSVDGVRNAIASSDSVFVAKASGVGKKTAERVVVDLSDKVGTGSYVNDERGNLQACVNKDEALEALMALGFSLSDASSALAGVPIELSTSERVSLALKGRN